jgi:hypothetical protein
MWIWVDANGVSNNRKLCNKFYVGNDANVIPASVNKRAKG